jgi:hypothetical protein
VLAATRCDSGALADADVCVVYVECGYDHTVVLPSDGGVIAFGSNYCGELSTGNNYSQPTPHARAAGVRGTGRRAHRGLRRWCLLLAAPGRRRPRLRDGAQQLRPARHQQHDPRQRADQIDAAHFGGAPFAAVACGNSHTMTITRDEVILYCWGQGANGRSLGHIWTTSQLRSPWWARWRMRASCASRRAAATRARSRPIIPAADREGIPQLLQGDALAAGGAPVRALSTGCGGLHTALIAGTPPAAPGFEAPLAFAMQKPGPKTPSKRAVAATAPPVAAQGKAARRADAARGTKRKRVDGAGARAGYCARAAPLQGGGGGGG